MPGLTNIVVHQGKPETLEWAKAHNIGCCDPVGENRRGFQSRLTDA
jgi:hypothetical protein